MKLVIGLGNPTERFKKTRHNLGFICLDYWAKKHSLSFSKSDIYSYLVVKELVLIKPNTYMNLSGEAAKHALKKWCIDETLVVHDDIELDPCQLRIRNGGGDGGHNGIKSLFDAIQPSDLRRIRVGIGRSETLSPDVYVLDNFTDEELQAYDECIRLVSKFIDVFSMYDFSQVLNEYSKWKKSYSGGNAAGIKSPKEEKG